MPLCHNWRCAIQRLENVCVQTECWDDKHIKDEAYKIVRFINYPPAISVLVRWGLTDTMLKAFENAVLCFLYSRGILPRYGKESIMTSFPKDKCIIEEPVWDVPGHLTGLSADVCTCEILNLLHFQTLSLSFLCWIVFSTLQPF